MGGRKLVAGVLLASALICATPVAEAALVPVPARGGGGGGGHGDGLGGEESPGAVLAPVIPPRRHHDLGNDPLPTP
jgi:hypothetical protein